MTRRACGWAGFLGVAVVAGLSSRPAGGQEGFRLLPNQVVIDRAQDWERWRRPVHATEIDAVGNLVRPRLVRKVTNAIADLDRFTILIGDDKALAKLQKDVEREGRAMPLNIRSQPAAVAGVPIVQQKDNEKAGIKAGDPILWFYYHGGIREAPRNTAMAANVLDGDPSTYWEPTTEVSRSQWLELSESKRGPVLYFVRDAAGVERAVGADEYASAPTNRRREEYHSHSLDESYVDIELGRVVPVRRIVLRFVDPQAGEPFRQFRILGTASHFRDAPLGLIARTTAPNVDEQEIVFDLDGSSLGRQAASSGHVAEVPEEFDLAEGAFLQLHRLRIALTDSRFDKFRQVSAAEYEALPLADRGSIEYHIVNAAGTETRVDRQIYDQVAEERRGQRIHYRRERPRLAEVEVWAQGDNIALGVIDGGGSVDLTGNFAGNPGFDGLFETNYLQLVWSPDARYANRGVMTLDLGARFWLDFFRMVGGFSGEDEVATWTSDGTRDPNGNLRWTEIDRNPSGQGRSDIEIATDEPVPVRYVRTQIFSDAPGRAGGYNTGDAVREMQIFGRGYPSEVTLTSPLIELPETAFLGAIAWEADIPDADLVDVEIRTRTGDRLVEVTQYFGSGGEPKTQTEFNKLPASFKGPTVTQRVPGGGWSPWSQRYLTPGQRVASPSPRRFLQIQARLLSQRSDLAASLRALRVEMLPPAALTPLAEVWPAQVELGVPVDFELFVRPTFVERAPQGQPSSRFDELLVDAAPIQGVQLQQVAVGAEADLASGAARQFSRLALRTDPATGAQTSWFEAADGTRYQGLLDPVAGDTLKVMQGRVAGGTEPQAEEPLRLRLPNKVASLPAASGTRTYLRRIIEDGDEVPVDEDARPLRELTYLNLPADQQGQVLHFEITGRTAAGEPIRQVVDEFDYRALPDSARGGIRYFRKLVGTGGEFAFDRQGEPLTEATYAALPSAERGSVLAAGQLVRVGFRAKVLLNGTTLDVAIRDSGGEQAWQTVDAGDATAVRPGADLSIAVPFGRQVVRAFDVVPRAFSPNGDGINDSAQIRFSMANVNLARRVTLRIYDLSGRLVWQDERMSFGDQSFSWDGSDGAGGQVPPGLYLCRVEVDADADRASRQADHRTIAVAY